MSRFAVAATLLGRPDFGYVTQMQMADVARHVRSAVPRAHVVDDDTGYGNALNVIRTIELYEQGGAAGVPASTPCSWRRRESDDDLRAIVAATPGVVRVANTVEGGRTTLRTPDELHAVGFDLTVSPLSGPLPATRAMPDAHAALAAHGTLRTGSTRSRRSTRSATSSG